MEGPVKLLPNRMDKDGIAGFGKLIHALGPQRHSEANEEHGFNQDHGEFQMGGNAARHAFVIGHGMTATVITNEAIQKKGYPTDKERAHEPMAKLEHVIELLALLRIVGQQTEQFV